MQGGHRSILEKVRHDVRNTQLTLAIEQLKKAGRFMGLAEKRPIYRNLVVIHYHLRPGGVRRIIELALPQIASTAPMPLDSVTLICGEMPEAAWCQNLTKALQGTRLVFLCEPAFRYLSEQRSSPEVIRRRIRSTLEGLTKNRLLSETLIWAHNLGLARNLILSSELAALSARLGLSLLSHHHDLWFENRWARWSEMRECGFRSLSAVARASFAAKARVCHVTINQLDNAVLSKHLGSRAKCLPNLAQADGAPSSPRIRAARDWLASQLGDDGPIWISPTRFLRRKNLAEAVQLTRWLRPEAWFITTAGVSSPEELRYARRLEAASRHGKWRVRFQLLAESKEPVPDIGDLASASEAMLLTSAQEGFGLPYLEAAALGRPLIARHLPNVVPDLLELGFAFPNLYEETLIAPDLLNLKAERVRQQKLWRGWKSAMPASCRRLADRPMLLDLPDGEPIPFSRLTLSGQLEILAIAPEKSWEACRELNPLLQHWQDLAQSGRLQAMQWPKRAEAIIGGKAYAARFWKSVAEISRRPLGVRAVERAQRDSIAQRLGTRFLYPILFGEE
jgi:glycosyltransferase involved in cell wall biosynthesis